MAGTKNNRYELFFSQYSIAIIFGNPCKISAMACRNACWVSLHFEGTLRERSPSNSQVMTNQRPLLRSHDTEAAWTGQQSLKREM
jgi:hypothetical protein